MGLYIHLTAIEIVLIGFLRKPIRIMFKIKFTYSCIHYASIERKSVVLAQASERLLGVMSIEHKIQN